MLNKVKNLLTRRQIIGSGIGILGVGVAGVVTQNSPAIAQPAYKPTKEPPIPDEKKLGWAVVGLGKFATQQIIPSLTYSTPNDPRFKEVEENVNFILRFPSGVLANCTSSYGYSSTKRFQVFGSNGTLELDPATDYYRHQLTVKREKVQEERQIQEQNQFALEMAHLSASVMQNQQPKTPGEEGLQDVRLMLAIYEAARTGRTISVDS